MVDARGGSARPSGFARSPAKWPRLTAAGNVVWSAPGDTRWASGSGTRERSARWQELQAASAIGQAMLLRAGRLRSAGNGLRCAQVLSDGREHPCRDGYLKHDARWRRCALGEGAGRQRRKDFARHRREHLRRNDRAGKQVAVLLKGRPWL